MYMSLKLTGKVAIMSVIRNAVCITFAALMLVTGAQIANAQGQGEFDAASFTCLEYTNGLGVNASGKVRSQLGHLWILGYLSGFYKASGNFEMSDEADAGDRIANIVLQTCRQFPQSSLLSVSIESLTDDTHKVPSAPTMEFTPAAYTCGDHVDAKAGAAADANKADLAGLWAFAFIQGYKNVDAPDMEIPIENKGALTSAIDNNCAKNRDMAFMDLTVLVAKVVKLQ
ncbi:MAG: hypothetical protein CMG46_11180 [Candidatus Marinimicrobia bacterium]|nr:hypothetical protein [Candidatus Neomarinimicrobiota bacterium]